MSLFLEGISWAALSHTTICHPGQIYLLASMIANTLSFTILTILLLLFVFAAGL